MQRQTIMEVAEHGVRAAEREVRSLANRAANSAHAALEYADDPEAKNPHPAFGSALGEDLAIAVAVLRTKREDLVLLRRMMEAEA